MAENRRSIDTKYWTDPDIEDLSEHATYLYLALMTFPENNMAGTYEISDKKMESYTKMSKDNLKIALFELQSKGKILRHKAWVCLKNHIKNQSLNGGMAVSAMKTYCEVPNLIKLWLFFKDNSEELESWFSGLCFNVNKYYEEQRSRYASNIVSKSKKEGLVQDRSKVLSELPLVEFTNEQLVKVMTTNLPFKSKELTNYNSMITLIQQLDNSPLNLENMGFDKGYIRVIQQSYNPTMNIKGNNEIEELNMNNEYEELKGNNEIVDGYQSVTPKPNYQTYNSLSDKITEAINHWNTKKNLPSCKYSIFTLPDVASVKTKFDVFRDGEILKAIDNLDTCYDKIDPNYRPKAFHRFIINSLDNWLDEAEPLKNYDNPKQKKSRTLDEESYMQLLRLRENHDVDQETFDKIKNQCIKSLSDKGIKFDDEYYRV